ncbi:hypothetical protein [Chryseolinea lacunae]|uniref:hypothetical protein n=1 Tax=Chryseolinea lacunae TaxID=2801331 RepID=UPI001920083F|nr:hypothetical protein [Chryseolinea lacunae]
MEPFETRIRSRPSIFSALPRVVHTREKIFVPAFLGLFFFNEQILWPQSDSNRQSLTGSKALNALPYFASPSGISVHLQILSAMARSYSGVIPAHCGTIYFYHRLFLLSYEAA